MVGSLIVETGRFTENNLGADRETLLAVLEVVQLNMIPAGDSVPCLQLSLHVHSSVFYLHAEILSNCHMLSS